MLGPTGCGLPVNLGVTCPNDVIQHSIARINNSVFIVR